MKIYNTLLVLVIIGLSSCNLKIPNNIPADISYNNILIYSDLSSRMERNPNDTMVISQLIEYFITDCVKPGIKINDRSSITFSRANHFRSNCPSKTIDVGNFTSLKKKQEFVNDKTSNNLTKAISQLKNSVRCNYEERDKGGLDLLSLIYREVNSGNHIKTSKQIIVGQDTTTINFNNRLFIFTDGYLEYSLKTGSKNFYFSTPQIKAIRHYCKENKVNPLKAIKDNETFQVKPLPSGNAQFVNLYIMETDDRGFNVQKGTNNNSGILSDNNILKAVWKTWAMESGFKSFTWEQKTDPSTLPKDYIEKIVNQTNEKLLPTSGLNASGG